MAQRGSAPPHRIPTCPNGHQMRVSLLHIPAGCDECQIPLPPTEVAWTCAACDVDYCHSCCIRKFVNMQQLSQAMQQGTLTPAVPQPVPQPLPQPQLHYQERHAERSTRCV